MLCVLLLLLMLNFDLKFVSLRAFTKRLEQNSIQQPCEILKCAKPVCCLSGARSWPTGYKRVPLQNMQLLEELEQQKESLKYYRNQELTQAGNVRMR